ALATALAVGAASCGEPPPDGASSPDPVQLAADGKRIAIANGCAACHGTDGQGGIGPTWIGLAGTMVELDDGSTVLADDDYLRRAIVDPSAEIRPGWTVNMPQQSFAPGDVDAMIAYIRSLGPSE
ncbi:MAG: cytochrome c, partial [Actinomycetota bacterium]